MLLLEWVRNTQSYASVRDREAKTKMNVTTPMVDEEEAEGVAAIGQPVQK